MLRNNNVKVILVAIVLAVFASCSSSEKKEQPKDTKNAPSTKDAKETKEATSKEAAPAPTTTRSTTPESTDKDKQKVGMRTADESQGKTTASLPETPPGSKPGQCWIPVVSPATYKEISESVEKKAPSERVELIPARYEIISEKILVKEASTS
ncbi:MAG: hypothetical protein KBF93_26070, partial [Leptospiraceae bacterium]|nr:hypothetical protein [Leptospiraceae bacterium]